MLINNFLQVIELDRRQFVHELSPTMLAGRRCITVLHRIIHAYELKVRSSVNIRSSASNSCNEPGHECQHACHLVLAPPFKFHSVLSILGRQPSQVLLVLQDKSILTFTFLCFPSLTKVRAEQNTKSLQRVSLQRHIFNVCLRFDPASSLGRLCP